MTDKSKITVVSLGPGPRAYLTLGVLDALKKAEQVILRTSLRCDAADIKNPLDTTNRSEDIRR